MVTAKNECKQTRYTCHLSCRNFEHFSRVTDPFLSVLRSVQPLLHVPSGSFCYKSESKLCLPSHFSVSVSGFGAHIFSFSLPLPSQLHPFLLPFCHPLSSALCPFELVICDAAICIPHSSVEICVESDKHAFNIRNYSESGVYAEFLLIFSR